MPTKHAVRTVNTVALLGLVGWVVYDAMGTNVFGSGHWPDTMVDYHILYEVSRQIVQTHTSPPAFPYPPPAVLFLYASAVFPFIVSAGVWMAVTIAAALASCWILVQLLDVRRMPYWSLPLLLAYGSASYFFQWDLRSQNCNLIFLTAVLFGVWFLRRHRPAAAGFCIAFSFSLKLLSLFVIPYLLWSGRRKAFAWTCVFLAVFWVVLPPLVFGVDGSRLVYADWLGRFRHAVSLAPNVDHPILISLDRSAARLAGGDPNVAGLILSAFRVLWVGIVAAGWWVSRRRGSAPDAFGLLADVSLLVLAPVAVSPYLEPYHVVAFIVPALLLVLTTMDAAQTVRLRALAALIFAASIGVAWIPADWELRGLIVNLKLFFGVGGMTLVTALRRPAAAPAATDLIGPSKVTPRAA
jgi:hypothetical protein